MSILIAASIILSCSGILLNSILIPAAILTKQLNSPNRTLLLHLSVVCCGLSFLYLWILIKNSLPQSYSPLVTIPLSIGYLIAKNETEGKLETTWLTALNESLSSPSSCSVNDLFINLLQPLSLWTIACINIDKYYAIVSPLHYNNLFTTKKVLVFLCFGWISILLTSFPLYLMLLFENPENQHFYSTCWFRDNHETQYSRHFIHQSLANNTSNTSNSFVYWRQIYLVASTTITIVMPIGLIIGCNVKVLTIASYQRHRIASAIYEATLSAQVAITHQKNPFFMPNFLNQPFFYHTRTNPNELKRKSQKALVAVIELVSSTVVVYCPYYLYVIWYGFYMKTKSLEPDWKSSTDILSVPTGVVQFLMLCSPTVNAILYGVKNKQIQMSIKNFWRKQKTRIELHYEIQARTPSTCGSRRPSITDIANVQQTQQQQPLLKRQLSDFFFGTSSSTTSFLDESLMTSKIHRTSSDSFFNTALPSHHTVRPNDMHNEFLSPKTDFIKLHTLNKASSSKNLQPTIFNNFRKFWNGHKYELQDDKDFPRILITKHSDSNNLHINQTSNASIQTTSNKSKPPSRSFKSLKDVIMVEANDKRFQTL